MLIIDRFEGDEALIETKDRLVIIPRADVPADAKEGDVLRLVIDGNETDARKNRIEQKMNKLFKD